MTMTLFHKITTPHRIVTRNSHYINLALDKVCKAHPFLMLTYLSSINACVICRSLELNSMTNAIFNFKSQVRSVQSLERFPYNSIPLQCSKPTVVHSSKTCKMYHETSENYDHSYFWTSMQFLVFIWFVFYEFEAKKTI